MSSYPRIQHYVRSLTGTSLQRVSEAVIDSAVSILMHQWGCTGEQEFLDHVSGSADARDELIHRTTIKETYFFRESDTIDMAVRKLIAPMLSDGRSVRILSAGCSTGAEVYTLAMAIHERLGQKALQRCSIIGIDIDPIALDYARKGIYSSNSLRGLSPAMKRRFFHAEGNTFRVRELYTGSTEFRTVNLIDSGQIAAIEQVDGIFYRNVSIYFDERLQKAVFTSLASLLPPHGFICTGSSETIPHSIGVLSITQKDGIFYFSNEQQPQEQHTKRALPKKLGQRLKGLRISRAEVPTPAPEGPKRAAKHSLSTEEILILAREKRYDEVLRALKSQGCSSTAERAIQAGVLYEQNRQEESAEICRAIIAEDPLALEPHILLGLISRSRGETADAIRELKQAVFLDQHCWQALYYIAECYEASGEREMASRSYSRVIETLQGGALSEHMLIASLNDRSTQQLIRLCHHRIEQIETLRVQ